jgi:hypothetical protein
METTHQEGIALRIGQEALEGRAVSCENARLHFIAPKAFPPGQPLALSLQPKGGTVLPLAARCLGSKRREDGRFDVQARLINLGRATREALALAFPQT